jgi:hypothetical protein
MALVSLILAVFFAGCLGIPVGPTPGSGSVAGEDLVAPVISNTMAGCSSDTTWWFTFTTDEEANRWVYYTTAAVYTPDPDPSWTDSITWTSVWNVHHYKFVSEGGDESGKRYVVAVKARDSWGNTSALSDTFGFVFSDCENPTYNVED